MSKFYRVAFTTSATTILALSTGCNRKTDSPSIDILLDAYTPQLRLGETVATARKKDPRLFFPASGSANYADVALAGTDGFRQATLLLGLPEYDSPPPENERVQRIELLATSTPSAGASAARRIRSVLGEPTGKVCDDAGNDPSLVSVQYWVADDGGVALQTPLANQQWSARLTFFQGDWNVNRVLAWRSSRDCPR
jgi:hypothetical protein